MINVKCADKSDNDAEHEPIVLPLINLQTSSGDLSFDLNQARIKSPSCFVNNLPSETE